MTLSFDDIARLSPGDQITFASKFGSLFGTVAEVKPGEYVSIDNGTGPWRITREHMDDGELVTPN